MEIPTPSNCLTLQAGPDVSFDLFGSFRHTETRGLPISDRSGPLYCYSGFCVGQLLQICMLPAVCALLCA